MQKHLLLLSLLFSVYFSNAQSLIMAKQFHGNDTQVNTTADTDAAGNTYTISNFWGNLDADPGPGTMTFTTVASMDFAIIKLNSAGDLVWAKQIGGTGFDSGYKIITDSNGDVFVFGYFNGTIDMDPGVGTYNLVSAGSDDVFCGKYNSDGTFAWAAKFGGTGTEQSYGFDLNSEDHVFVHGYFQNTVDFDPGPGTFNLTAGVSGSDFLVELDNDGLFQTAIKMGVVYGNYMMFDPYDNLYIAGLFWGTVDFDPGPGVHNLVAAGFGADASLLKLNGDLVYQWAVNFSGNSDEQCYTVGFDATNNDVIVGGIYQGTMDANPGVGVNNLISVGYVDGFVIKLNDDGTFIWAGGIEGLGYQTVQSLDVDVAGNIHATGAFEQTADFDPSAGTYNLSSNGYTDIFRMVLTPTGELSTAESIGGIYSDWANSVVLDNTGSEMITGYFDNIVDFDPGPGTFNLNSDFTGWDGFLALYCTVYNISNNVAICEGESYFAGGAWQTEPGDYYDYYDPVEGCDSIVITHLTVNNPVVNLGADDGFCEGGSIVLDAENAGATYNWNTGATTQTITVTTPGTYSVLVTDNAGCTATDAITIEMFPSPNVNLGADISVCAGETVILDAGNEGSGYLWNTGATTQTISVTTTGNYGVTVTNGDGCTDFDVVHVDVNSNPVVDLGDEIEFCANENVILDAGNPGSTFNWSTGATTQQIIVNTAGIYSVEVTNAAGCQAGDEVELFALAVPEVDLGGDITVCEGVTVILDAGNPGATFAWTTGDITQTIEVNESGDYGVTVTNAFGCSENDMVTVTINPSPVIELGGAIEFCDNTVLILDAENPGSEYLWTTGETTQEIIVIESGTYGVTITNDFGCSAYDEVTATVYSSPTVELGPDTAFCEGSSITLDATTPGCTYDWSTGETIPAIQVDESGTYTVIITNDFGCTDTDAIFIEVYPAPDVEFIIEDATICLDADPVTLNTGTPAGGVYSGTGVTDGVFDPADAGLGTFTISYTYTDAMGCTGVSSVEVEVEVCQGIDNADINQAIQIYPNPTMGSITLDPGQLHGDYSLQIIDLTGQICYTGILNVQQTIQLDLGFLPSGQYLIELNSGDVIYYAPVVINK